MRAPLVIRLLAAALCALCTAACTGQIVDEAAARPATGARGTRGEPRCGPDWTGIQRLNRREYINTLRDLLGADPSVAGALPNDPLKGGFDTNASALAMTPELYDAYVTTAERAVESVLATSAATLLPCTPERNELSDPCMSETISRFAERAYRRPLDAEDVAELEALYRTAAAETGDVRETFAWVLIAIVSSPKVLYRSSFAGAQQANGVATLDDFALASRLSYFLWSSTPDGRLLDLARQGLLGEAGTLRAEVERMLRDDRAAELTREFTAQWLDLRGVESKVFDTTAFPELDPALLPQMVDETAALVRHVLVEDVDPVELLTASYSFVGADLARHYGVDWMDPDATGPISLPRDQRRGILTHGSFLAATAHPDRTSIPARGMWVMENVLCMGAPPPPPPGIDTSAVEQTEGLTQRERFEVHRSDPTCRSCHQVMDELGFGLENYDAIGRYRTTEGELPIDARGTLPGGAAFDGAIQLADVLAANYATDFRRCLSENLLAYAIGRLVTDSDDCELDAIAADPSLGARELLVRIVSSDAFRSELVPDDGEEVTP